MPRKRTGGPKKKAEKKIKLDVVAKEWSEQTTEEKTQTITAVTGAFNEMQLRNIDVVVAKETQYPKAFSRESFAAVGCCTESQGTAMSKYENLMDCFDKFEVEVSQMVIGQKMPFLVSTLDLEMKESSIVEDRAGKVIYIQFWTPGNERCEEAVANMIKVAEAHKADWGDKVAFMAVACQVKLTYLKKILEEKKWLSEAVHHSWAGDNEDEDADNVINKYEIESLPETFIVDMQGKLAKRTDPEDIVLEEVIASILKGEDVTNSKVPAPDPGSWQSLDDAKRAALVAKASALMESEPNLADCLLVTTQAEIHPHTGGAPKRELDVMVVGKVDIRAVEHVQKVMDILVKEGGVTDVERTVVVTAPEREIEPAAACSECKKAFADMDQKSLVRWHCAMSLDAYTICAECEPKKDRKHPKNYPLMRLGPHTTETELKSAHYKIGSFAVGLEDEDSKDGGCCAKKCGDSGCTEEPEQDETIHEDVFCNGCQEPIMCGPRWKCCVCADFDFCDKCLQHWAAVSEGTGSADETKKLLKECPASHFYLRIPDSDLVQIAEDEDEGDEGDEGDFDGLEFSQDDMAMLTKAMAGGDLGDDADGLLAKIRALRASGQLDDDEDEGDLEDALEAANANKLNALADEAAGIALPDDDDF